MAKLLGGSRIYGNVTIDTQAFVSGNTAATSTSSGALIVSGGIGAAGNIYGGGTLVVSGNTNISGTLTVSGTITPRVSTIADGNTFGANCATTDIASQINTQVTGTLTLSAPTGTPVNGQKLMFKIKSSNVQTFSWDPVFAFSTDITQPTATTGSSKTDYLGFIYDSTASKWQLIAKNFGF